MILQPRRGESSIAGGKVLGAPYQTHRPRRGHRSQLLLNAVFARIQRSDSNFRFYQSGFLRITSRKGNLSPPVKDGINAPCWADLLGGVIRGFCPPLCSPRPSMAKAE